MVRSFRTTILVPFEMSFGGCIFSEATHKGSSSELPWERSAMLSQT